MYVFLYVYICNKGRERETYYKELAYAIMEAGKSKILQHRPATWRPRRANGAGKV